jgi:hypothetical protein
MSTPHVAKAAAVLIAASAVVMPAIATPERNDATPKSFVEVLAGPEHQDHATFLSEGGGTNVGCSDC